MIEREREQQAFQTVLDTADDDACLIMLYRSEDGLEFEIVHKGQLPASDDSFRVVAICACFEAAQDLLADSSLGHALARAFFRGAGN
jgi:hypothetical protein